MPRLQRASIKDIARRVGVSVSTVSYALNDGPKPVAADLKAKIRTVADELDYRPNRLARRMARRQTEVIGVIHTVENFDFLRNSVIREVLVGVSNAAQQLHHDILMYTHPTTGGDVDHGLFADGQTDGNVFIFPDNMKSTLLRMKDFHVPIVIVEGTPLPGVPRVEIDNELGARLAVEHLIRLGHRKIAHVHGAERMYDTVMRRDSYLATMAAHGLEVKPSWLQDGNYNLEEGYLAMTRMLRVKPRPTAVFVANDHSAVGVMKAIFDAGLRVPEDISVVGFDDAPEATITHPKLTTVRQPLEAMGEEAVRLLMKISRGEVVPEKSTFPVELVVRESTGNPTEES